MDTDNKHIGHDLTRICEQHDFQQGLSGLKFTISDEYLQLSNTKQMTEITGHLGINNKLNLLDSAKHYYIDAQIFNQILTQIQSDIPSSYNSGRFDGILQIKSSLIEISEKSFKDQIGEVPMISLNAHKRSVDVYEQLSIKQKLKIIELESKLRMEENKSGWLRKIFNF